MATLLPGQTNARNAQSREDDGEINAQIDSLASNSTSTSSPPSASTQHQHRPTALATSGQFVVQQILNGSTIGVDTLHDNETGVAVLFARRNAVGNIFDGLNNDELARLRTTTMVGAYNGLRI